MGAAQTQHAGHGGTQHHTTNAVVNKSRHSMGVAQTQHAGHGGSKADSRASSPPPSPTPAPSPNPTAASPPPPPSNASPSAAVLRITKAFPHAASIPCPELPPPWKLRQPHQPRGEQPWPHASGLLSTILIVGNLFGHDELKQAKVALFKQHVAPYVLQVHFIHSHGLDELNSACGPYTEPSLPNAGACAAYVARSVLLKEPRATGFLYAQADYMMSADFFARTRHLDLHAFWTPRTPKLGMRPGRIGVYQPRRPYLLVNASGQPRLRQRVDWHWPAQMPQLLRALDELEATTSARVLTEVCGAWSDMYYVPASAAAAWSAAMFVMADHDVMNEIAVCTARLLLGASQNQSSAPYREQIIPMCQQRTANFTCPTHATPGADFAFEPFNASAPPCVFGGPTDLQNLCDVAAYPAAHKVNLGDPCVLEWVKARYTIR